MFIDFNSVPRNVLYSEENSSLVWYFASKYFKNATRITTGRDYSGNSDTMRSSPNHVTSRANRSTRNSHNSSCRASTTLSLEIIYLLTWRFLKWIEKAHTELIFWVPFFCLKNSNPNETYLVKNTKPNVFFNYIQRIHYCHMRTYPFNKLAPQYLVNYHCLSLFVST